MFNSFMTRAGFGAAFVGVADEVMIRATCSGNTAVLVSIFKIIGVVAPAKKAAMLRFLAGDALKGNPIKGDASPCWGLFCAAVSAALSTGNRAQCDSFEVDCAAAIAAVKGARAAAKAIKSAAAGVAAPAPAPASAPAPVSASALDQAIGLVESHIAAGTISPSQARRLEDAISLLAIPA